MSSQSIYEVGLEAKRYFSARKWAEDEDEIKAAEAARLQSLVDEGFFTRQIEDAARRIEAAKNYVPHVPPTDLDMKAFYVEVQEQEIGSYRNAISRISARLGETTVKIIELTHKPTQFDKTTDEALSHFRLNEEAYYDLAVIEACLKGVELNIEHPVVAGELPAIATSLDHNLKLA